MSDVKELCLEIIPGKCTLAFTLCEPFEIPTDDTTEIKLLVTVVSPKKACLLIEPPEEYLRDVRDQLYFLFRAFEFDVYTATTLESCQDSTTTCNENSCDASSNKKAIDLRQLIKPALIQKLEQDEEKRFETVVHLLYLLCQSGFIAGWLHPFVLKLLIDTINRSKTGETDKNIEETKELNVEEAKELFDSLKNELGIEEGKFNEFNEKVDPVYWQIAKECLPEERAKYFILLRVFRNIIAHMDEYPQYGKIFRDRFDYAIFSSDCFEVGKYVVLKRWMQADNEVIKYLVESRKLRSNLERNQS